MKVLLNKDNLEFKIRGYEISEEHGLVSFEKKIDDNKAVVISPQTSEVYIWFEDEEIKLFLDVETIDEIDNIVKCIIGIE